MQDYSLTCSLSVINGQLAINSLNRNEFHSERKLSVAKAFQLYGDLSRSELHLKKAPANSEMPLEE